MAQEHIDRTKQAIIETDGSLQRALAYAPDLQDCEAVRFYEDHLEKLKKMLEEAGEVKT